MESNVKPNWPSYKCCHRCGCLMDISLLADHLCAAQVQADAAQVASTDIALLQQVTYLRDALRRIGDPQCFDTVLELKKRARKAIDMADD